MTSVSFLLCQQMCLCKEITLLSNGISRNFAKAMVERYN